MKLNEHIFLIGFMGCGKSTNARYMCRMTGAKQLEMDQKIVADQGMAITEIFARYGEEHFRTLETELIRSLKETEPMVVSCGGGAVLREENVALMKECGKIVLLTASPETIYDRVKHSTDRPILNGNMNVEYIAGLMETRRPKYEAAADLVISTEMKNTREICEEILNKLERLRARARRLAKQEQT